MSASLDLNSNKVTNLADGTNNQDAVTVAQLNAAGIVLETAAAVNVTITDAGGYYVATSVEAALQELWVTLASSDTGDGAALIGVEDSAGHFAGATVEAVLAELQVNIDAIGGLTAMVDDTTPQLGGNLDANGFHINMADEVISRPEITDYGITSNSLTVSANAVAVSLATGNAFEIDLEAATGTVTITLSNPPASGTLGECLLKIQQDTTAARAITWAGGTFVWPAGTAPTMTTTADGIDLYSFKTWNGGTTWYGTSAQAFS